MKRLITLAAAASALVAGNASAQSQVTVYGVTAVEAIRASNVVAGTSIGSMTRLDNSQVSTSRLGLRGAEDMGGGLFAIFGLESGVALDTGAASNATKFWNRNSYVGLRGGFGTMTAGRLWNLNDDLMGNYFIFGGYSAFRFTEFGFISDLVDNAVKYVSPTFGGLQFRALGALGENVVGRTYELGASYAAGPLSMALTYRDAKGANNKSDKLTSGGISYAFGDLRVHAGYSAADPKAASLPKAKSWDVGVVFNATPALITTLDYVTRDQSGTGNDSNFWRLGADYYFSKRTSIITNMIALDNKGTASQRFYGSGAAGKDQNVFSLGLRHLF